MPRTAPRRLTARYTIADLGTADLSMLTDTELDDATDRAEVGCEFGLPIFTAALANVTAERNTRAAYAAQLGADIAAHDGDVLAALIARLGA